MRSLYIQANMGVCGDMLMSALLELMDSQNEFIEKMNTIGFNNLKIEKETVKKSGILATHMKVLINNQEEHSHEHHCHKHTHHHHSLEDVFSIIDKLDILDKTKEDAKNVYKIIADAESKVHGEKVSEIHFHEVGMIDAICDIVGVCYLVNELQIENIVTSSINLGSGNVKAAHGILPVPTPATANILKEVPVYLSNIKTELTTPTGAALVKYFSNSFDDNYTLNIEKIGYGAGTKDLEQANILRVFLGNTKSDNLPNEKIVKLSCNIDDMTGEEIGYAISLLMEQGAYDSYVIPINMKKNRPAIILECLTSLYHEEKFMKLIFKHTSSLGIRREIIDRYTLNRTFVKKETKYGQITLKRSTGYNVEKEKIEYADLEKIARENDLSISKVKKEIYKKGFTK